MESQENVWLAEYRRGDTDALGKLAEHYRRPLFGFILRMTEGREGAEEIFQEVWYRVIRNLDSYREKRFLSWLFRIAHNLIIDRARKARPVVDLQSGADDGSDNAPDAIEARLAAPGLSAASEVVGHDLGRRIAGAVGRLPPEQREVFLMRMEGDLPFKEIARIQGTSINTALARMQYALAKLRNELKNEYQDLRGTPS
jgi:RNA polymerase sigma-70 factor, ECF subfamily